MDDSGTHGGSQFCVLAGYFGGVNQWKKFNRRWQAVLDRFNITEFHAKHFWARDEKGKKVGEYRGWTKELADSFMDQLLFAIGNSVIYPFAQGVEMSEWNKLSIEHRRFLTGANPEHPHGAPNKIIIFPFQHCVTRVASYCKPGIKVHFVFDENPQTEAWATICYNRLKRIFSNDADLRGAFGDLTFADSRVALPLQAADLLAYEANHWARLANGDGSRHMRFTYSRALIRMRSLQDFKLFDKVRFDHFRKFIAENSGKSSVDGTL